MTPTHIQPRFSRRSFFTATAASFAAFSVGTSESTPLREALLSAANGGSSARRTVGGHKTTALYRSRPDLHPPIIETTQYQTPSAGFLFLTPAGPLICDSAGSPVWIHPVAHASTNFQVQRYRGHPVLTWWEGEIAHYGVGLRGHNVIMDSSYRVVHRVQPGHGLPSDLHEFTLTDRGTALLTAYVEATADLSSVGGPSSGTFLESVFQEVDVATGRVVLEWRSSKHIKFWESYTDYRSDGLYDPVHLNSIGVMEDGNLLVSARNTWGLYKVDRTSGQILWRLGGKRSDFTMGKDAQFAWQHDARSHHDGSISLFDDEGTPFVGPQSRGLILDVDEHAGRVAVRRSYYHPKSKLRAGSQGSLQIRPDGNVVIGWGSQPYVTEYRYHGARVLDAKFLSGTSYRAYRFEWNATPHEPVAIAAERTTSGTNVFASWNGATQVAGWQVRAGATPERMHAVAVAPKAGFETVVPTDRRYRWLSVEALDVSGRVLAESPAISGP